MGRKENKLYKVGMTILRRRRGEKKINCIRLE
jgi:hypothetical protein